MSGRLIAPKRNQKIFVLTGLAVTTKLLHYYETVTLRQHYILYNESETLLSSKKGREKRQ